LPDGEVPQDYADQNLGAKKQKSNSNSKKDKKGSPSGRPKLNNFKFSEHAARKNSVGPNESPADEVAAGVPNAKKEKSTSKNRKMKAKK